jgi:hypothetical protein
MSWFTSGSCQLNATSSFHIEICTPNSSANLRRNKMLLSFRCPQYDAINPLKTSQSQSYFTTGDLPPISPSWRQAPWDSRPAFSFQLNTCFHSPYVTSSLIRGWVCRLQLLVALASAFSGPSPAGLMITFYTASDSRLPQPGGQGPRIYIPQEYSGPVTPPGTGFPFGRLLRLAGLRWRYPTPPPLGLLTHRKHITSPLQTPTG